MNIDIFDKLRSFVERAIGSLSTKIIWLDDAKLILETVDELRAELARLTAELNEAQRYIKALEANTSKSVMKRLKVMVKPPEEER